MLDGVNAASLAMMAAVSLTLAREAFFFAPSVVTGAPATAFAIAIPVPLFAVALWLLVAKRVNSAWLVLGGALVGLAAL